MNNLTQSVKRYVKQVQGLFPTPLPQGVTAFNAWVDSLMSTYALPTTKVDDVRYVLAGEILRFGPLVTHRSNYYFVRALRAVAAKQIAGQAFQDIKERQFAAQREAAAKPVEATILPANGVSNEVRAQ